MAAEGEPLALMRQYFRPLARDNAGRADVALSCLANASCSVLEWHEMGSPLISRHDRLLAYHTMFVSAGASIAFA
jgi:hypothetical protein